MFFKMLKSDLKRKKGLNIILFTFISVAAVLIFTGAMQIFSYLTKDKAIERLCKPSDILLVTLPENMDEDEINKKLPDELSSRDDITEWEYKRMTEINYTSLDFDNFDEKDLKRETFFITPLPQKFDLVYDLNDLPFYVPNGCVAITIDISQRTGAKTGDILKYTTETGYTYELKIDRIFKENITGHVNRIIVSDADYEILTDDSVIKNNVYGLKVRDSSYAGLNQLIENINQTIL